MNLIEAFLAEHCFKITGARLVESKQSIPHYYLSVACCVDKMSDLRARINDNRKDGEPKVSVNDFVLKACAVALRKVPEVNSQWAGESIRQMHSVDLSVAVQTGECVGVAKNTIHLILLAFLILVHSC